MAQVVSTWGTRIQGIRHHLIGKPSRGFFKRGASNLATDCDPQIRVPHVLKNMGYPAWGWNATGQTDAPAGNNYSAISGGQNHSLALVSPTPCPADLTGDGKVDAADLAILLGSWGTCPE